MFRDLMFNKLNVPFHVMQQWNCSNWTSSCYFSFLFNIASNLLLIGITKRRQYWLQLALMEERHGSGTRCWGNTGSRFWFTWLGYPIGRRNESTSCVTLTMYKRQLLSLSRVHTGDSAYVSHYYLTNRLDTYYWYFVFVLYPSLVLIAALLSVQFSHRVP